MQLEFYSSQSTQATGAGGRTVSGALMEVRRGFFIDCTEQQSEPNVQMKASGQISMFATQLGFPWVADAGQPPC